uniref:MofC protein n=1 Tax=Leptothrix discophora TaxID=89 RepID=Q9X760_LEPDI|nr:mofC [Leptothrix discophora]
MKRMRWSRWALGLLAVVLMAGVQAQSGASATSVGVRAAVAAADPALVELGRRLYRQGLAADGQPLVALRGSGLPASGEAVACVNCHRNSGLGAVEGNNVVPPITGRYLFELDGHAVVQQNIRGVKAFNQRHEPYDETSVALALRGGRHVSGRELDPLMPRYQIDDASLKALLAYLRQLSATRSPGVQDKSLRLATVITPEVDAERRRVFIDTVSAAVRQKNGTVVHGGRSMASAAEMLLRTERRWEHEFWELSGPSETWAEQLQARYAQTPVFALLSGLGGAQWAPVHQFCERQALPCWFPSVDQPPPESETDHYSVYFSRGLWLEADVLLQRWRQAGKQAPHRVLLVQGHPAQAPVFDGLQTSLVDSGIRVERLRADAADPAPLRAALRGLKRGDAAVLWLRPTQVEPLAESLHDLAAGPAGGARLVWSDTLLRSQPPALPAPWLAASEVVSPYLPSAQRDAALSYFRQWLQINRLPVVDEVLQSEAYFALTFFNDMQVEMLDNLHRDYLLDRAEAMLTQREASRAEDESREQTAVAVNRGMRAGMNGQVIQRRLATRPLPGRMPRMPQVQAPSDAEAAAIPGMTQRAEGTTVYPRLSLAPGQRHAAKGAQVLRYEPATSADAAPRVQVVSDWFIP